MSSERIPLAALGTHVGEHIDLFICCASFEGRSRSVFAHLDRCRIGVSLIYRSSLALEAVDQNLQFLKTRAGVDETVEIQLDSARPIWSEDAIVASLTAIFNRTEPKRILVDISTFTREFLFFLLNHVRQLAPRVSIITLAYVSAEIYSCQESNDEIWLSQGVREIRSVAGFPGEPLPAQPRHLIVLAGFETQRVGRLIEHYEPDVLSVGYAALEASISARHYETHAFFHRRILALYEGIRRFEFMPDDPIGTADAVTRQVQLFLGHNVVLAAMNTKLSAVGALLAAMRDHSIQLCYAQAEVYNYDGYSRPSQDVHLFRFPL